jgi:hypothetical protein
MPGQPVATAFVSSSGYEVRVLQGAASVGQQLALSFTNLLEAKGKEITDHYAAMRGSFETFDLPAAVYGGMSSYGHIKPAGSLWRYASPPKVQYVVPGVVSVEVELLAVPG